MKRITFLFLFIHGHYAFAQTGYPCEKIVFNYSKGHSTWERNEVYSNSEIIEFTATSEGNFRITRFYTISHSVREKGKKFTQDSIELPTKKYTEVSGLYIQNMLTQLNTHKENYSESFVKSRVVKPSTKEIKKIAKSIDEQLFFDRDFKEERRAISKKIRNLHNLDSFLLETKPETGILSIVSDAWHYLSINAISTADTTNYHFNFFKPLGQPISWFEDNKFNKVKIISNLEANTTAQQFIPKESRTFKILDMNNIKEHYIEWYLEKYF